MDLKTVCVYSGAFSSARQIYKDAASEMGKRIGEAGLNMVYGGGNVGLVGLVADGAITAGAKVTGIIPTFITSREPQHHGITELIEVSDMHTRKRFMADRAEAFIILPGGFGTLDEFAEIMTWRQLGLHNKPIVVVNVSGYWENLRQQILHMQSEGFIKAAHYNLISFVDRVDQVIPALYRLIEEIKAHPAQGPQPAHDDLLPPT